MLPTRKHYHRLLQEFLKVHKLASTMTLSPEEVDSRLSHFMDQLYLEGLDVSTVQKLLAAVQFHDGRLTKRLLRAMRALMGWRRYSRGRMPTTDPSRRLNWIGTALRSAWKQVLTVTTGSQW